MKKIPDTTLAYLAGMIDADGYITIHRGIHRGKAYYSPQVGIAGTRSEPHELAASLWGGKISKYLPKNPNHLPQYQWSRMGKSAIDVILEIYPFLLIKKKQAELAESLWFHLEAGRGDNPYPWMNPCYNPEADLFSMKVEMITINQSRRRLRSLNTISHLDGVEYKEFPVNQLK